MSLYRSWLTGLLLVVLVHATRSASDNDSPTTSTTPTLEHPLTSSTTETASSQPQEEVLPHEPRFPLKDLIVDCFATLSLPCAQRKMLVYLDQLNRARSVSIFWEFLELVRVRPDTAPPITEKVLYARKVEDQDSLSRLLEMMVERFMDSHVLRLNLPTFENGRLVLEPVDINFVTAPSNSREGRGVMEMMMKGGGGGDKKGGGKMKKGGHGGGGHGGGHMKGGKMMMKVMGKMMKMAVGIMAKMMMFKMMMMVPIAMKKSMLGGMAGLMSLGMMKMMMFMKLFDSLKNKIGSACGGGGIGSLFSGGGGGGGGGGGYGGGYGGGGYGGSGGGGDCGGGGGGGWDRVYTHPSTSKSPYAYYAHNRAYSGDEGDYY